MPCGAVRERDTWPHRWRARSHSWPGRPAARAGGSRSSSAPPAPPSTSPGAPPGPARSEMNRPETIEETAALVDAAGGRGIAVPVDHLVPDEVRSLVERIDTEQGRLHVLVNDIWGATTMEWDKTVWESLARERPAHPAPGRRHPRHHQPLRLAAAPRDPGRPGGRDDRRHRRVQRHPLPGLVLLRPGQGVGEPDGVRAGPRAPAARRHRRVAHPRLAALRGDARALYGVTEANWRDATARTPHFAISETPGLRRPRRGRAGRRRRPGPLERQLAVQRRAGQGLRLHRPGRQPAGLPGGISPRWSRPASRPT